MGETRRGYLFGAAAYVLWGALPLYLKALRPATPVEILANRVLWSMLTCLLVLLALRRWAWLRELRRQPRTLGKVAAAAVLVAVNWGTYIYAVNSGHVVEAALGYFINPLVSILLGVVVLRERLRRTQWLAIGFGAAAVLVIAIDYGRPPWIALVLAASFGGYGLAKKTLRLPAAQGMFAESAVLAPLALVTMLVLAYGGHATFGTGSPWHTVLLLLAGPATAIPLLLFAGAANRIPLSAIGILQYLAPTLQFLSGVLIFHEPMPPAELAGFALVWVALVIFSADALRHQRRVRRAAAATRVAPPAEPAAPTRA